MRIAAALAIATLLGAAPAAAQQVCNRDCARGTPRDAFGCCLGSEPPTKRRTAARRAPDTLTLEPRFVDLRPRAFVVFPRVRRVPSFEQVVAPAHHAWRSWLTAVDQLRNAARAWNEAQRGYSTRLRALPDDPNDPRRRAIEAELAAARDRARARQTELEGRADGTRATARAQLQQQRRSGFDDLALAELTLDEDSERFYAAYEAATSAGEPPPSPLPFFEPALRLAERAAGRLTGSWKAYAFYFAGYLAMEGMDYVRALSLLERAVQLDGSRSDFAADAWFRIGQHGSDFGTTPEELGRAREAYTRGIAIETALGRADRLASIRYQLAWVHRRLDEPTPALAQLVAVAASDSELGSEAAEEAAGLLYNAGDYVGRTLPADTPGPLAARLLLVVGERLVEEEALPLAAPVLDEAARRGGDDDPNAILARRMGRVVRSALGFAVREDTERWLRRAVERCRPRLFAPHFDQPPVDPATGFEIDFAATRAGDATVVTRAELRRGASEIADRTLRCLRDPVVPPYGHTGSFRVRARLVFPLPRDPVAARGI